MSKQLSFSATASVLAMALFALFAGWGGATGDASHADGSPVMVGAAIVAN